MLNATYLQMAFINKMEIIIIELTGLRFFGRHGLYKEEQKIGGEFEINLCISYAAPQTVIHSIDQTINYATVHTLLKKEMGTPTALLETFVMQVSDVLKEHFPIIQKIEVAVKKVHPPMVQFTGNVTVRYIKEF